MSGTIITLTDDNFATKVLQATHPVLVDFWAEWCSPCHLVAPALESFAQEYAQRLAVGKLDVDSNPLTPPRYQIRGIPTLILFENGQVVASKIGAMSKFQLTAFMNIYIK